LLFRRNRRWVDADNIGMSFPREVLPGTVYMITRRCTQRQFLMRPDPETNNAFIYCLAEAAAEFDIDLVFTMANTNHHHTGIYDREGVFPAFIERFHKLFAKCLNSLRGRSENFWSSEQTSAVRLVDPAAILDKMIYALTNPVKDDLVARADEWPGVSALEAITQNRPLTAERPKHFFRKAGRMPPRVCLKFVRPPGFENLSPEEFANLVIENVRQVEQRCAEDRRRRGVRVLGREGVLRQDWRASPKSQEERSGINPRFAARSRWSRIEALQRNRAFREEYAAAREAFLSGARDVVFPAGTYWLRRFARVTCRPHEAIAA
jgi:putative transposase